MPLPLAELALIDHIRRNIAAHSEAVRLGIGDDCAILRVPRGHELLVTTDFSLEGRHFRRDWHTPESAGHRCLARGLSDIAAMGGKPLAAFLSLALPPGFDPDWVNRFLGGFNALATRAGVQLAGGDTAQAPGAHILADIVLTGAAPSGRALRRSGARPGDILYVSVRDSGQGRALASAGVSRRAAGVQDTSLAGLGGSAVELTRLAAAQQLCPTQPGAPGAHPQSFPEPRLALGQALLRRRLATAAMDLSDGLSTDLHHLCNASGVSAEVDLAALPVAAGATLEQALSGGEDYELLFTAAPETQVPRCLAGSALRAIGRILPAREPVVTGIAEDGSRQAIEPAGWEHFRSGEGPSRTRPRSPNARQGSYGSGK